MAGAFAGAGSAPARAEGPPSSAAAVAFAWTAPEGCADREGAVADLGALLGTSLSLARGDDERAPVHMSVSLTALEGGRVRAEIATRGPGLSGERTFEGASCARVTEAALLVVAMTYDPLAATQQLEHPKPAERPHPARTRVSLGARVAGDLGSLPGATLGFGALAGVHHGGSRLEVEADFWLSRVARNGPHPDSGGEIGLATGALRGCVDLWQIPDTDLRLGPCIGAELGVSSGQGLGLANPRTTRGLWGAALAGFTLTQTEGPGAAARLRPWVSLEAGAALVRPTFGIDGFGDVFSASPVIGRAAFGVAWMFP